MRSGEHAPEIWNHMLDDKTARLYRFPICPCGIRASCVCVVGVMACCVWKRLIT
jgi:hypothetical protein